MLVAVTKVVPYLLLVTVNQQRVSRKRTYLMCSPEHFTVEYAINPWMDVTTAVDADLAVKQWDRLRETLVGLGHDVHLLTARGGAAGHGLRGERRVRGRRHRLRRPVQARAADRRGRRAPGVLRGAGLAVHRPERDQRGRGRLRVPAGGARRPDPRRARLPDRAGRARRGAGGARPPGGLAAPDRPALLPPGRGARLDRRREHRLLPGRLLRRQPEGAGPAVPGRDRRRRRGRAGVRAEPGQRRAQRGAEQRGDRGWPAS